MNQPYFAISAQIAIGVFSDAARSQDVYSTLPYRSRDGWHWDAQKGVWRNPRPTRDRVTNKLIYETRSPAVTTCCDRTGLSFPSDAANSFEPPKQQPQRQQVQRQLPVRQARPARDDSVAGQIERIKKLKLDPEVEKKAIENVISSAAAAPPASGTPASPSQRALGGSSGRSVYRGTHPSDGNWEGTLRCSWGSGGISLQISGGSVSGSVVNAVISGGSVSGRQVQFESSNFLNTASYVGQLISASQMSGTYSQSLSSEQCRWNASKVN